MKKRNILLPFILIGGLVGLTGCSLFDDKDLEFKNEFNPVQTEPEIDPNATMAGGVPGKEVATVSDALCFKNICYAKDNKIINTYKVGGPNYTEYNVNGGEDYYGDQSSNNYDLYVPNGVAKNDKHMVILFIHGGAWVSGFKTDVNPYIHEFANKGYITATLKYTLLSRQMNDPSLSIFRNLDEIDACITSIKSVLEELGFDTTKSNLVLGGASSGAHLAMLYSYSRGYKAAADGGSAIPIRFIVDGVGPVNIQPDSWKAFSFATEEDENAFLADPDALTYDSVSTSSTRELSIAGDGENKWNAYQTMRIANGMCGLPYTLEQVEASSSNKKDLDQPNDASNSMTVRGSRDYTGEELLSVGYWIDKSTNKIPLICAYAGKDTIVGINQYATLQHVMELKGYTEGTDYRFVYFPSGGHTDIKKEKDETNYNKFVTYIEEWCVSKLA